MSSLGSDVDNESSKFTLQEVQTIAQKIFDESLVKVLSYRLNPFSKEKLGFTTSHQLLQITVEKKNVQKPETVSLFVKSISLDQGQADLVKEAGLFDAEFDFFGKIFPWLNDNYNGFKWAPVCYLVKNDVIVMEDLRNSGFELKGRLFDKTPLLKSALTALARFHSCTIVGEAIIKHDTEKTTTLKEQYPDSFKEKLFPEQNDGMVGQWINSGIDIIEAVAKKLNIYSPRLRESYDELKKMVKASKNHRNVIGHGDLWSNNLMFDDTKPMPKCILVDFQCTRYAPLVLDLLHFVYVNSTRSYRQTHELELIKFYHQMLEKSVILNDSTKEADIPSLEETLEAYNHFRLFGVCLANLYFPFILMDSKVLGDKINSEGFHNVLFGDRTKLTLDHMDQDRFFKARVEEAVKELVDVTRSL